MLASSSSKITDSCWQSPSPTPPANPHLPTRYHGLRKWGQHLRHKIINSACLHALHFVSLASRAQHLWGSWRGSRASVVWPMCL